MIYLEPADEGVVVVFDQPRFRHLTVRLLETMVRCQVIGTSSCSKALSILRKHGPHYFVVEADLGKDRHREGLELAIKIRRQEPTACVIMLTVDPQLRPEALKIGVDLFVDKGDNVDIGKIRSKFRDIVAVMQEHKDAVRQHRDFPMGGRDLIPEVLLAQRLLRDPEFRRQYAGKYVFIVDGQLDPRGFDNCEDGLSIVSAGKSSQVLCIDPRLTSLAHPLVK